MAVRCGQSGGRCRLPCAEFRVLPRRAVPLTHRGVQHAVQSARELAGQNGETAPRRGAGEGDGKLEKAVRGRRGEYGTALGARHTRRHRQSAHSYRRVHRHVRGGLETRALNAYYASHRCVGGHDDDARRLCQDGQLLPLGAGHEQHHHRIRQRHGSRQSVRQGRRFL